MSGPIGILKDFFMIGGSKESTPSPARSSSRPERAKAPRIQRRGNEIASIETLTPNTYADAGLIAEVLRDSVPVIVNVQNLTESDTRRLVDFMAGLKAGLMGESKRVSENVYLLAPFGVEIDGDADDVLEAETDRLIIRP